MSPADIIRRLLELVRYQDYLEKTQEDADSRWQNVQELITFAIEMEGELGSQTFDIDVADMQRLEDEEDQWQDRGEDEYDEEELDDLGFAEVKSQPATKAGNVKTAENAVA